MSQTTDLTVGQELGKIERLMSANEAKLWAALPSHITPDRMKRVALTCIRKNPKLLECTPASLLGAISEAATYGWELGGVLAHAYLVPYKDEAVMIPGYKGLLDLCHRSGQLADVQPPAAVREGDEFDFALGDQPFVKHKPARDPQRLEKPISYVYWVVNLRSGGTVRLVKSIEEIRAHRDQYSQSYRRAERYRLDCEAKGWKVDPQKLSAWHTAEESMAGKTLIREAINRGLIPMSSEFRTLAGREQTFESQSVVEASAVVNGGDRGDQVATRSLGAIDADSRSTAADSGGASSSSPAAEYSDTAGGTAPQESAPLEQLDFQLAEAEQLLDCEAIGARWMDQCTDNSQRLAVAQAVKDRQDQIRLERGK